MRAGEIMSRGAATVKAADPLAEAARIMVERRISGLPVVVANGTLVGIVRERDFLRADEGARPRWIEVLLDQARSRSIGRYLRERKVRRDDG
jgi:CBS domain-containing protein